MGFVLAETVNTMYSVNACFKFSLEHFQNHILIEGLPTLDTWEPVPGKRNKIGLCSHLDMLLCT